MRFAFSIIMFVFGGALLLYAGLVSVDPSAMLRSYAVKTKNMKAYAKYLGKVLAVIALAPILCGVFGLFVDPTTHQLLTAFISIDIAVVCIFLATRIKRKDE